MLFPMILAIGWLGGVLVNYFADILPNRPKLEQPYCIQCEDPMDWWKYVFMRTCAQCGKGRSIRAWIVQIATAGAAGLLWWFPPLRLPAWEAFILLVYLGLIMVIDIENRLILYPTSLVGVVIGLGIGVQLHGVWMTLLGGAAGFGIMLVLYYFGVLFNRFLSRTRSEDVDGVALGFGDVSLSGILGLILGWPGITVGLLVAILAGGLLSGGYLLVMILAKRYKPFTALPYAPFLILAAMVLLFRP